MKNIIIYGMRGSGKTTLGYLVSQRIGIDFYDLDKQIETFAGEKLTSFIDRVGWDEFRRVESQELEKLLAKPQNKIISLGGGAITIERNQKLVNKQADKLIYVDVSIENIASRIQNDEESGKARNSLTGKSVLEELEEVCSQRKSIYNSFYDFKVDNNKDINDCIAETMNKLDIGLVCIPITDFSTEIFEPQIEIINSTKEIKYVEIRIDFIDEDEIEEKINLIKKIEKQVIITNRNALEGGQFEGDFNASIEKLLKFKEVGDYFDLELLAGDKLNILKQKLGEKKLIISYHNFEQTPELQELKEKIESMKKFSPDVYKVAVMPNSNDDLHTVYSLQKSFQEEFPDTDHIFISMGATGMETRVKVPQNGGLLSFATLGGKASAPGQIDYQELHSKIFK